MDYKVIPTSRFKKDAKRLFKKYPSLIDDLLLLEQQLIKTPEMGTDLGRGAFKIRLAIRSKGKGKSGGARVISYLVTENFEIYLLAIYDKSEVSNIDTKTLKELIKGI